MKEIFKIVALFGVILSVIPVTDGLFNRYASSYPRYYDPEIKLRDYYEKMGVDILKNDHEIVIVDNRSGHIIYELSPDKPLDAFFYTLMEDILLESSSKGGIPSASYWKR